MQVSMVRDTDTAAAAPSVNAAAPEEFKGHYVQNGQVVRTLSEAIWRTDISSLQVEYESDQQAKAAAAAKKEDTGYSWNPITIVGRVLSSVFGFFGDMVRSILGICRIGGNESAAEARPPENPNAEAPQA